MYRYIRFTPSMYLHVLFGPSMYVLSQVCTSMYFVYTYTYLVINVCFQIHTLGNKYVPGTHFRVINWYVLVCTGMYQYMIFGTEFLSILKGTSVDILVIPEYIL
jgi:hypothetical protein